MKRAGFALAGALILAGCGDQAPQGRDMSAEEVASELSGLQIQPGLWETSSEIVSADAPGMPREMLAGMRGQRNATRHCITPEQAARPDANFLAQQEQGNCTYRDFSMADGRMRGTMTCGADGSEGQMTMAMDGDYGPERYDLTMDMTTAGLPGGGEMRIEARTSGRRIGDCEGDSGAEGGG